MTRQAELRLHRARAVQKENTLTKQADLRARVVSKEDIMTRQALLVRGLAIARAVRKENTLTKQADLLVSFVEKENIINRQVELRVLLALLDVTPILELVKHR